jgi:hypothetical protein
MCRNVAKMWFFGIKEKGNRQKAKALYQLSYSGHPEAGLSTPGEPETGFEPATTRSEVEVTLFYGTFSFS